MKKFTKSLLALIVLFSLAITPVFGEEKVVVGPDKIIPETTTEFTILHTNDIHASISGTGFVRAATYIKDYVTANPNTIVVDAGDFSQGGTLQQSNQG